MNDTGRRSCGRRRGVVQSNVPNVPKNNNVDIRGRGRGRGVVQSNVPNVANNDNVDIRGRSRGQNINPVPPRGRGRPRKIPFIPTTVDDFSQATSNNLPTINFLNVAEYFKMLRTPEMRQSKDVM